MKFVWGFLAQRAIEEGPGWQITNLMPTIAATQFPLHLGEVVFPLLFELSATDMGVERHITIDLREGGSDRRVGGYRANPKPRGSDPVVQTIIPIRAQLAIAEPGDFLFIVKIDGEEVGRISFSAFADLSG